MGRTQRFGLTTINDSSDGSLSEDGYKYTGRDRRVIDRLLAAMEQHNHTGGERLEAPEAAPGLELFEEGGNLQAGVTYYYRVSYIDRYGLETAGSSEASVAMPDQVAIPDVPMLEALTGGSLEEDLYYYALTALDADGNETPLGSPNLITITDRHTVRVSYTAGPPDGAAECHVWRQKSGDSGFTKIGTIAATVDAEFLDDGTVESDPCPCDPLKLPPQENETRSTNAVQVTIPVADVQLPTPVRRWRIYRSAQSGVYPTSALVEEVVETDGDGQLVTEFLDTGGATLGQPLNQGQTLEPSRVLGEATRSEAATGLTDPVLLDSSQGVHRVVTAEDGALALRESSLGAVLGEIVLVNDENEHWVLGLTDDLALTTEQVTDLDTLISPVVFPAGFGPYLPSASTDPLALFMLTVDIDGALVTTET